MLQFLGLIEITALNFLSFGIHSTGFEEERNSVAEVAYPRLRNHCWRRYGVELQVSLKCVPRMNC